MTAGGHRGREERGSWRARLRELLAAAVDLLRHCTVNQFEVWRNGERMTALPVLIADPAGAGGLLDLPALAGGGPVLRL